MRRILGQEAPMQISKLLQSWKNNRLGLAQFLGRTLAHIPSFTDFCCRAFGEELFTRLQIIERIEFLYRPDHHKHLDKSQFDRVVQYGIRDDIAFIEDLRGDYRYFAVMTLRHLDNDSYAIRLYATYYGIPPLLLPWLSNSDDIPGFETVAGSNRVVTHNDLGSKTQSYPCQHVSPYDEAFWNFGYKNRAIQIYGHSEGFTDIGATRCCAKLIEWTTNMLGFENDNSLDNPTASVVV
jgi:hypothetical protein